MNNDLRGKELFPDIAAPHETDDRLAASADDTPVDSGRSRFRLFPSRRRRRTLALVAARLTSIEGMFVAAEVGIFVAGLIVLLRSL